MLRPRVIRATFVGLAIALCAPAGAQATALFDIQDGTVIYNAGADQIDQVAIFETATNYRFIRFGAGDALGDGGGCQLVDPFTVDCPRTG
jgi:hypothetical protein